MASITLENVSKIFDEDIVAVDQSSIQIEDGEFVVIVGPSGSGKSTTLRMIAGLDTPTEGKIFLGSDNVTDKSARERDIAMVFQNYALYPHMTVRENLGFGLKLSTTLGQSDINERVEEIAELLDIDHLLDQEPKELSGGQQQRVALGRAIIRYPEAFLFDEPLSNLDANLRNKMRTEIKRLQQSLEVTSVYVTHNQAEAMTMGDRIIVMHEGQIQQIGTPGGIYNQPANRFVAEFIGEPSINLVDVVASAEQDSIVLRNDDAGNEFEYQLPSQIPGDISITDDDSFTIGIRPEDLNLKKSLNDQTSATAVQIDVVEPLGSDNFHYFTLADNDWTARTDSSSEFRPGETAEFVFDFTDLYIFDMNGNTIKYKGTDIERSKINPS